MSLFWTLRGSVYSCTIARLHKDTGSSRSELQSIRDSIWNHDVRISEVHLFLEI